MRVSDVAPDRWQRSVAWIRTFTELLGWQDQRVALALFAHRAAPQVRLTRDPNALFFFLDHLGDEPPFRLEDDTSWDTNIEEGIYWGVQMFERDAQLHGERPERQGVHRAVGRPGPGAARWTTRSSSPATAASGCTRSASAPPPAGSSPSFPPAPTTPPRPPIHSALDRQVAARDSGGRRRRLPRARRRQRAGHRAPDPRRRRAPRPGDAPRGDVHRALLVPARGRGGARRPRHPARQGAGPSSGGSSRRPPPWRCSCCAGEPRESAPGWSRQARGAHGPRPGPTSGSSPVSAIVVAAPSDARKSMSRCAPAGLAASAAMPAENVVTRWYSAGMGPA